VHGHFILLPPFSCRRTREDVTSNAVPLGGRAAIKVCLISNPAEPRNASRRALGMPHASSNPNISSVLRRRASFDKAEAAWIAEIVRRRGEVG
jgi:hypothetical protein